MRWWEKIAEELGIKEKLPSGYQKIGDIIILNLPKKLYNKKKQIGEAILEHIPKIKTVCLIKGIRGEYRKPDIEVIAGNGTETIHKENGCEYLLDVKKVMFSKGNVGERGRMKKDCRGIVLDMFAGIGYFSIPASKSPYVKKVYSIEKNPESYRFLIKNIKRNNAKIEAFLGDCRDVVKKINIKADTIIMGLLPDPYEFLDSALSCSKNGTKIIYHTINENIGEKIRKKAEEWGFSIKIKKRGVKKYAPHKNHVVLELSLFSP